MPLEGTQRRGEADKTSQTTLGLGRKGGSALQGPGSHGSAQTKPHFGEDGGGCGEGRSGHAPIKAQKKSARD